jgi:hypothetical protein
MLHITVKCLVRGCSYAGPKYQLPIHLETFHVLTLRTHYVVGHQSIKPLGLYHDNDSEEGNDPDDLRNCDDCQEVFLNKKLKRRINARDETLLATQKLLRIVSTNLNWKQ